MNVAILGIKTIPATAGADRVVEKLLPVLPTNNQYTVYVLKGSLPLASSRNITYIPVPALPGKHARPFSYFTLCTLHVLMMGRYDVVHAHNSDLGLFCLLIRALSRMKLMGTFHGNPYEREKWGTLAKRYLKMSEFFFVRSCHILTSVSRFKVSQKKEIMYIPNGIDTIVPQKDPAGFDFGKYGLEKEGYILFACGRLDSTKGLHHLLKAYQSGHFSQKLLVVGDFSHDPEYAKRIERSVRDTTRVVFYKTLLPLDLLYEVVRNCRLFVFPSEVEAMSMMLLESVSCKKLVVCSDIRENVEIVGANYKYLFSLERDGELLKKMVVALEDPGADAITRALFERCMTKYAWESIGKAYGEIYERFDERASRNTTS